jgi:hypothetical protein
MMSDAETLARLRRRAAKTENVGTLRHIADETSDLAGIAPECLLSDVADFQDRIAAKIERLGGKAVSRRQQSADQPSRLAGPAIRMCVTPWVEENGVRSRMIYSASDVPP